MKALPKFCLVLIISLCVGLVSAARAALINITDDLESPASFVADYNERLTGSMGNPNAANWLPSQAINSGTDLASLDLGVKLSGLTPVASGPLGVRPSGPRGVTVPEGGLTIAFLGLALAGIWMARRKFCS